ncbi:SWIM zinc finger family protein [Paenibacillus radicis (ex Xue et al. 2023)]|uniref:SWIM-type domain-containing protein n=1 Tax=Paenibacillus radicis (ex Xue et al. 2023) TaxID=2972489 RepID=A0ABT1YKG7_9BACL|nr:hypothetical protein [Paenibacillus radicis (ex Xue et al. 2023)]MCR8633676.1 hypothetical protein [Paenibacillus radicis (ex Xue et al. 2023)]
MKLEQIENTIDPIILERGEAYRDNGSILSIEEVGPLLYRAKVEGSELYGVEVRMDSRGEVIYTECNCPYDMGPVCKHVAAVLLEIREELSLARVIFKSKTAPQENLPAQLSKLSKEELIELLVHFSKEIKEVELKLTLKFSESDRKVDLTQYKKMIRSFIKKNSDRYGFVPYRNVPDAVSGAEMVMEKACEILEKGHCLRSIEVSLCVLREMGDLLQACDDSGGFVGGIIQECLNLVQTAVNQRENIPEKDRVRMFQLILKEAVHPSLEGWNDNQLSLLESAADLISSPGERGEWERQLEYLENKEKSQSHVGSYFFEIAAQLRYQVIQRNDGAEQARKFLEDHLDLTPFRKMAIEDAMTHHQFEKALQLAEQGEHKDALKGYPGLVNQWKKFRYEIYRLTQQVEQQVKLAEEFVVSGEYTYYSGLKELLSKEEWPAAYERILNKLDQNRSRNWNTESLYTRVLIEEKETRRLLDYVRNYKRSIVDYYPHLMDEYAEDVFELFRLFIVEEAKDSTNRKHISGYAKLLRI